MKFRLPIACMAILMLGSQLFAQISTGTITGIVTDPSGAVVPRASVRVTAVETKVSRALVTNSAGLFVAPNLLPGQYAVEVSKKGFQTQSKVGLALSVGQTLTLNFALQVGAARQAVTVVGKAAQLVDTTTSTLGNVITKKPVQDLPLNGRNFQNLIPLTAGVAPPPPGSNQYFVNGSRGTSTAYLIDGADVSSPSTDPIRIVPNLEAIGEFKVTTNNFDAEYGRALGGIVNVNIRSGTNAWHGSVFEYFRNKSIDARNFFDTNRLPYNFNQFGASLGGPIRKNKLFIFGDYQGTRIRQSTTVYTNVPTLAEDAGNFSDLLPNTIIYDPATFPRQPFDGNVIPKDRQDPASALMFSLLPKPNAVPTPSSPYNYVKPQGFPNNQNSGDLRVDYNPTAMDRISGVAVILRPTAYYTPLLNSQVGGNLITTIVDQSDQSYSLHYTHIVSPTMVNEFVTAFSRDVFAGPPSPGMQYEPNLGIPGLNTSKTDTRTTGFPLFVAPPYNVFGAGLGGPFNQTHNVTQVSDTLSWVRGPHSFKMGFSGNFRQYNLDQSLAPRGEYVFLPYPTGSPFTGGNAAASALMGYPYEVVRQILLPFGQRIKEYGAFVQDTYKVNKRLTLDLGGRWDLYTPSTEAHNRLGDFNPSTVTVVLAGQDGRSASTLDTNYKDFSPHVGFAYQLTSDGKTALRGGYAIGYLNLVTQGAGTVTDRLEENPPFALSGTGIFNPFGLGPVPRVSDGFPLIPVDPQNLCCGVNLVYIPQSQGMPYEQQWNLDLQRTLPGNFLLDVAYVGSHGVHLTGSSNINQAPPGPTPAGGREPISSQIGTVDALMNRDSSSYNALQVKLEHRFSSGFYLLGSYTYSHSIDNGSVSAGAGNNPLASSAQPQNSFDLAAERGPSDFDVRHRAVISYIYALPFGRGKKFLGGAKGYVNALLGGWQVNGITTAQSGFPFTPKLSNGSADINSGPGGAVRPYLVGNPNLSSGQTISHWFNVAAFAVPGQDGTPPYTFGNAGRNILRGPGLVNFDFSLFKNFNLTERLRLQFRTECFNIFNHPNFGLPNPYVDLPQAGIITSTTTPPRQIQFALKLLF